MAKEEVKEKNWAQKLKDKVVSHFDKKKKERESFSAYVKEQKARSADAKAKKGTAKKEDIMKGQNLGTKKKISDLKKYGGLSDDEIKRFIDKPQKKGKK